ncbi:MAG: glycoside hydrolase family 27 protein, partial [Bacteriovoracales bacterium]
MFNYLALVFLLLPGLAFSNSLKDLALTPPMGWNTWNTFKCKIDEKLIRESADVLVSSGMRDAGYEYINIDDCWQLGRNPDGTIQVDAKRFPSGMKALADYVHSKG